MRSTLDREVQELYVLTVLAVAGEGEGRQTGSSTVRVTVTDENDNSPRLSEERYFFTVVENRPAGSSVGRVAASDRDAGQNSRLTYRLVPPESGFLIHTQTGERRRREGRGPFFLCRLGWERGGCVGVACHGRAMGRGTDGAPSLSL